MTHSPRRKSVRSSWLSRMPTTQWLVPNAVLLQPAPMSKASVTQPPATFLCVLYESPSCPPLRGSPWAVRRRAPVDIGRTRRVPARHRASCAHRTRFLAWRYVKSQGKPQLSETIQNHAAPARTCARAVFLCRPSSNALGCSNRVCRCTSSWLISIVDRPRPSACAAQSSRQSALRPPTAQDRGHPAGLRKPGRSSPGGAA